MSRHTAPGPPAWRRPARPAPAAPAAGSAPPERPRTGRDGAGLLTAATVLSCPHGGRIAAATAGHHTAVRAGGAAVATAADTFVVAGCPRVLDGVPRPCVTVRWEPGSGAAVRVDGRPVLLERTAGECFTAAGVPQGPPVAVPGRGGEVSCR